MRIYADTSFLVKLVIEEADSEQAMAEFRRLKFPRIFYTSLHALETGNAIRHRALHTGRTSSAKTKKWIANERDNGLMRIERWVKRGWLLETATEYEPAFERARELSEKHTERLGCRGFDLLHIAVALKLKCESFLTADKIQADVARAEGLDVRTP